jgi:hypothetical protein
MQNRDALIDTIGFGFCLWLAGYLASLVLFFVLPPGLLGWVLFAVFAPITVFVAYWRFNKRQLPLGHYLKVAVAWTIIAIVFDYIFIVVMLKSADYYKLDVLVYYAATFLIPAAIGLRYAKKPGSSHSD